MERQSINKYLNKDKYVLEGKSNPTFMVLDCQNKDTFNIEIKENQNINLLLLNIQKDTKFDFNVLANSSLNLKTVLKGEVKTLNINAKVQSNGDMRVYCADFSDGDVKTTVKIDLSEDNTTAMWHLASLSAKNDNKEFDVSLIHNAKNTFGLSDNYGVSKDDARLVFSGISHIKNGAKYSKTRQNAKIMVFDDLSKAIARPILKIDENEIEASHGASVGKINDESMFYLTSRGLTEEQAKELITMGYLKPILVGFEDEEIKEEISSLIEGRM